MSKSLCDHLESVALVDKVLPALVTKIHFLRVCRDQSIEERVELLCRSLLLAAIQVWTQDAPESLRLLTPCPEVRGDLDDYIGFGQVNRGVSHLAKER